jgi:hypothetical protein
MEEIQYLLIPILKNYEKQWTKSETRLFIKTNILLFKKKFNKSLEKKEKTSIEKAEAIILLIENHLTIKSKIKSLIKISRCYTKIGCFTKAIKSLDLLYEIEGIATDRFLILKILPSEYIKIAKAKEEQKTSMIFNDYNRLNIIPFDATKHSLFLHVLKEKIKLILIEMKLLNKPSNIFDINSYEITINETTSKLKEYFFIALPKN